MQIHQSQKGFSVPHLLLGLVGVAIIGFAGWRVYEARKEANKSYESASNANEVVKQDEKQEESKKEEYKIPEGYTLYENKDYGFKFAYPAGLGQLKAAIDSSVTMKLATPFQEKYPITGLEKSLVATVNTQEKFRVAAQYKGAIVKPTGQGTTYAWYVTETGQNTDVKAGDLFSPAPKVAASPNGVPVFDFPNGHANCWFHAWAFPVKNNHFVQIQLPDFCPSLDLSATERDASKAQYDAMKDAVLRSIRIL